MLIATPEYAMRATPLIWLLKFWAIPRSCETLTASVEFTPAATLVMVRSAPDEPTDTLLSCVATELAPKATELLPLATAPDPMAVAFVPVACDW